MAEWIPYLEAATQLKVRRGLLRDGAALDSFYAFLQTNKNKEGEAVYVCEGL